MDIYIHSVVDHALAPEGRQERKQWVVSSTDVNPPESASFRITVPKNTARKQYPGETFHHMRVARCTLNTNQSSARILALKELHPDDTTFKQVRDEFRSLWKSKSDAAASPTVEKIYEIQIPNTRQLKDATEKVQEGTHHSPTSSHTPMTTSPYRISIACATLVDRKNEIPENGPMFVSSADGIIPAYVIMFFK
ncbi:hypothetical protein L218DRAFT_1056443 [Marasmius fiardii PR-910]|nr:hypothetical protein L218DRAFT_1056443 [Marasmius fiardii PR-910]